MRRRLVIVGLVGLGCAVLLAVVLYVLIVVVLPFLVAGSGS